MDSTVDAFIAKAKTEPNQQFTIDVINTSVEEPLEQEIPANMQLLVKCEDCQYGCDHQLYQIYLANELDIDFGYYQKYD